MYVDGANHRPQVEEVPAASRQNAVKNGVPRETPITDALYLPGTSHPAHILRDRFEHLEAAPPEKGGYPVADPQTHRTVPVAGLFETLRSSLGEDYHDEIANLESAVASRGVPLIADPHTDSVVYHAFLEAYQQASAERPEAANPTAHDLLDTAG